MGISSIASQIATTTPIPTDAVNSSPAISRPINTINPPPQADTKSNCCEEAASSTWCFLAYGARYLFLHLNSFILFRFITFPIAFLYNKVVDLSDAIRFRAENRRKTPQMTFSTSQIDRMQKTYFRLGQNKIVEGMEKSFFDNHGPYVFDRGLHGGTVEPGFKRSWERASHFLGYQFQNKVDADFYLKLHTYACDHFMGSLNGVLMEQNKLGTFRDNTETAVSWTFNSTPESTYPLKPEAEQALNEMSEEIKQKFGTPLAHFDKSVHGKTTLRYTLLSKEQVRSIYNYFSANMYAELERAQTQEEKFRPICKFFRNCEWLHAVRDGCGRCDLLTFNFLLTQHGFHPTCCNAPYLANTIGLEEWENYVREGMTTWRSLTA